VTVHRFRAMGCDVVLAGGDPGATAAVFERWEAAFSLFRPESEISRLNASPAGVVSVSPFFAATLRTALEVADATDGLVHPALGHDLRLSGVLVARAPGVRLDLNGVVKALAVDEAAARLDGFGFVSCGGDLAVCGPVDVGLPGGDAIRVVEGGLATSGTRTRGRHIVDPATGAPSASRWSAVTVSGASCLEADAAAKAAYLLGDDGPDWLEARGMPGRFLDASGRVTCNAAWSGSLVCM
jgi:thiamine biosynthesis lipoprotein